MTKTIEFVCTANNGRSPLAEAVGKAYVKEKCLESEWEVTSSGARAKDVLSGKMPLALKKKVILATVDKHLDSDIYGSEAPYGREVADDVRNLSDDQLKKNYEGNPLFRGRFDTYAELSRRHFADQEKEHARIVGREYGIEALLPEGLNQTVASDAVVAVLAMDKSNADAVRKIYAQSAHQPDLIEAIMPYVTGDSNAPDVPNTFGQPVEAYKVMAAQLREAVPRAIDKVVADYERKQATKALTKGEMGAQAALGN